MKRILSTNTFDTNDPYMPSVCNSLCHYVRFPALPDFLRSSGSGRGPLSLVRIIEELLERKAAAPV
jgi:hypothetical protein